MSDTSGGGHHWLGIYLRGMAMGAADVVPGVSGGTVAFINGIYERLLEAISACNGQALRTLYRDGVAAAWARIDGTFLLVLFAGIISSVVSLAKLITYALEQHPTLIWAFFFGLILASGIYIARHIGRWRPSVIGCLLGGMVLAYAIGEIKPTQLPAEPLYFFLAGAVAICAMILPGISGSFILLLLGMYSHVLTAIKTLEWQVLLIFIVGCLVGLLGFTRILSWLLRHYHNPMLALLTGFLLGSLNLVWPWKHVLQSTVNDKGETIVLQQTNVMPERYQALTGADPQWLAGIGCALLGVALVVVLERMGAPKQVRTTQKL